MNERPPYDHDADDLDADDVDLDDELDEYDEFDEYDEQEYVDLPRTSSRRRRVLTVLGGLAALLLVVVVGLGLWVSRQIDPPGEPGEPRDVEIPEGSTSDEIGALLAEEGIISSDLVWSWYLRINGGGPFQAGVYELAEDSAMGDVVDI